MTNPIRGDIDLQAGDEHFTLRMSVNAIIELETLLDMGVNQVARLLGNTKDFRLGTLRAVLWAALREHHKGVTLEEAGAIIAKAGANVVLDAVSQALASTFPERKADTANPRKAKRGRTGNASSLRSSPAASTPANSGR